MRGEDDANRGKRDGPPVVAIRLALWRLPEGLRDPICGDLENEYRTRVRSSRGRVLADLWFWGQVLTLRARSLRRAARISPRRPRRGDRNSRDEEVARGSGLWLEHRLQDLRFAFRSLRRSPGFAVSALLILALGIGANTALFSVVKAVFLQQPPVANADRLVAIYTTCRLGFPRCGSSYPDYLDYRDRTSALEDLAVAIPMSVNLAEAGEPPALAEAMLVSGNYFELIGLAPATGRLLQPTDDRIGAPVEVGVLSYASWSAQFGRDPEIVGRTVTVNRTPFQVVGVTPEGFRGTRLIGDPDLFLPVTARSRLQVPPSLPEDERAVSIAETDLLLFDNRGVRWMSPLIGRLIPDATAGQARSQLLAVSEALREEDPEARGPRSITLDPAGRYLLPEQAHAELPRFVLLVGAVVGLILALACANIANLLLARGASRSGEIAMRRALGADRGRVVGELVTESLVLGLLGGALGLILAPILANGVSQASLPGGVELGRFELGLDRATLVFAVLAAVLTSLVFGLVPSLRTGGVGLTATLKGEAGPRSLGGNRLRKTLVGVQTALCILLLVGSGLFIRTVRNGLAYHPGFDPENLSFLQFDLGPLGLSEAEALEGLERLETRITGLPGVRFASVATDSPLAPGGRGIFFEIPDYVPAPDEELRLEWIAGSPGTFSTWESPSTSDPISSAPRAGFGSTRLWRTATSRRVRWVAASLCSGGSSR